MKKIIVLLLIFIAVGCETTNPPEETPKPAGYQEDIPWPSLADSPWPIDHADAQSTGRSKYSGPSQGVVAGYIETDILETSIVLGAENTLYYCSPHDENSLIAVNNNGEKIWSFGDYGVGIRQNPLIGEDGTIYYINHPSSGRKLFAVNPDGTLKWSYPFNERIGTTLGIDKKGNLIFITEEGIISVNQEGKLNRKYSIGHHVHSFSFSPDGNTIYLAGQGFSAIDLESGATKWKLNFDDKNIITRPVVDAKGNIYIIPSTGKTSLICFDPEGKEKWNFPFEVSDGRVASMDPTIDKNGNLYFGADTVYSVDHTGKLRWQYSLEDDALYNPVTSDKDGNIYLATKSNKILSFTEAGKLRWGVDSGLETLGYSPAIGSDGRLYFPNHNSRNIVIIK